MNHLALRCAAFGAAVFLSSAALGKGVNGIQGSVSATDSTCATVNGNLFTSKDAVYVKPVQSVGQGTPLQDGAYYVRVTSPDGTVLGASAGTSNIAGGKINGQTCLSLVSLVGAYQDTNNAGGEYKVWLSTMSTYTDSTSKTDNFKVRPAAVVLAPDLGKVTIAKFYDANVDGYYQAGEPVLAWKVQLDELNPQSTPAVYDQLALGPWTAREFEPAGNSVKAGYAWVATNAYQVPGTWTYDGPDGGGGYLNKYDVNLTTSSPETTVVFGNVCIGPEAGGRTLGYWSNKNGQADMNGIGMANALASLGWLVNANGSTFHPGNYAQFRNWLLNGTAVNMAYMLSVQTAALRLSVLTGKISLADNLYVPGAPAEWGANPAGFISVAQLLALADNQLTATPYTRAGIPVRTQQEAIKNAIDNINNNRASFAQPTPGSCGTLAF